MRNIKHLFDAAVMGLCLAGCGGPWFETGGGADSGTVPQAGRNIDQKPVIGRGLTFNKAKPVKPISSVDPAARSAFPPVKTGDVNACATDGGCDDVPDHLMLVLCDADPPEVAVPLNAADHKWCDSVQASAYRQDDSGAYGVDADFTWKVADPSIAQFMDYPQQAKQIRRLSAATDAFHSVDGWSEPETVLTVCAVPLSGGTQFTPLCADLPVRDTVNVEGSWCLSGAGFDGDCQDMTFLQDGRDLYFTTWGDWDGEVRGREIKFTLPGYDYEGTLDANDFMYGYVREQGKTDILGTWSGWRLPMY